MIINTKWLEKYTEIPFSPEEMEERLTFLGLETSIRKNPIDDVKGVIIAKVLEVSRHPNADLLSVCRVYIGNKELEIVCGAPNVAKGQKVPLALLGTTLPNGITLKPTKIRGVQSEGMICAEDELGISEDHTGIMVLDDDAPIGMEFSDYLNQAGKSFDVDLTPNRPDCASHLGIAREITLLTGKELHIPEIRFQESEEAVEKYINVEIQNPVACPRYTARVIRYVKVGPSPKWLVSALKSIGLRSINNVVDASNFVLMETGHPLHTFDYKNIHGQKIIVRNAMEGEVVQTLDGLERKLSENILLICDARRPIAVAGIMGLANSEIELETTDVLIESAYFDPGTIRKGSKFLGLQTDASYRFERGTDPDGVIYALNRLTDLIVEVAGGKVCQGIIDQYSNRISTTDVRVRFQRIYNLIGIEINRIWVRDLFRKLGATILKEDADGLTLISPSYRPDLTREVDYIEEVVRVYGMSQVPSAKRLQIQPSVDVDENYDLVERLRSMLCSYGYDEVYNNSLVSERMAQFGFSSVRPVKIQNPLSQDMAFLRTSLIPGMIQTAKRNFNRKNMNLHLFELGFIQIDDPTSETHASEYQKFALLVTGEAEEKHWAYPSIKSDVFNLKGVVEDLSRRHGISTLIFELSENEYFRHLIKASIDGKEWCYMGQLDPKYLLTEWDIDIPLFVLEADVKVLIEASNINPKYEDIPVFPSIERDISIWVPEQLSAGEAKEKIRQRGGKYLKQIRFYDLYNGKSVDKWQKSFTFNLVFQANDRTLKDEEVDQAMAGIYEVLEKELNAKLR